MNAEKKKRNVGSKIAIVVIIAYLLLPLIMTLIYSLFQEWIDVMPTGFTLGAYAELFTDPLFWQAVGRTVIISIVPIVLCTVFVLLAMYVVVVYHPEWDKMIQILCTIPYAIQGVILPICVLSLYSSAPEPFGDRMFMLVGGHFMTAQMYLYDVMKKSGQRTCAVIVILFLVTLIISACAFFLQSKGKDRKDR